MHEAASLLSMSHQDARIGGIVAEEGDRLRDFIRRRVPDPSDAEDLLQEVWSELVAANRLLMPIDHVTGWLFRVARNRIVDLFRKRKPVADLDDLLPAPEAGPEALFTRKALLAELVRAIGELPSEQRDVFVAHEIDGRSFKELAAATGVNINTLLARKRYAVLRLRSRLRAIHDELKRPVR
jgi:RNA polymerase sigma factor (sigma-70 family)